MKSPSLKAALCLGFLAANSVWAIPNLQLDIVDQNGNSAGLYYGSNPYGDPDTTVAQSTVFTLRALLKGPGSGGQLLNPLANYYVSAAIVPTSLSVPSDFGPVKVNGVKYGPNDNASDFQYGVPPADDPNSAGYDAGDLPKHGIFPTTYLEFKFNFGTNTVPAYNVVDGSSASGTVYYYDFQVDATLLLDQALLAQYILHDNYDLHFDLYDEVIKTRNGCITDTDVDHFAPFSHDASTWYGPDTEIPHSVPEGGTTVLMIGLALLGLGTLYRMLPQKG